MRVKETHKHKSISNYFRNSFVWKVMWWKNKSESVLHEETDTREDLSLKVQNIYIKNAIIISVHFDIPRH